MIRIRKSLAFFTLLAGIFLASPTLAGDLQGPFSSSFLGVAAEGYDVVSYFTERKPVEGEKSHSLKWKGVEWRFSSADNQKTFESHPEKYAPQYGGYCAYAVSQGYTAGVDPEAWSVVDGKLYLNYSKSVQKTWVSDKAGYIKSANDNWPSVRNSL